jgi:RNA polymerase sigma factor (sigma-70 family)
MPEYKNSDMLTAINEYVHNSRYRDLLRLKYCDGHTYEEIAEIVNFSPQHVKRICREYRAVLMSRF